MRVLSPLVSVGPVRPVTTWLDGASSEPGMMPSPLMYRVLPVLWETFQSMWRA